ncbi:uncharacterized protein DUF4302 [Ancylomarina subtilis]|uniref:Uncharacterized protein DUF4302 n=1 Tax=Ancylomarina subtilis TaxID=1639035 RepID=A0A4Q7V9D4_9BACT|nr:DUF4302 domain-containing protein [Ancylomarina subtilis]RZT92307.1 uncharacterized protein DUF4302 [Ancylomarina subtilis]
MKKILYLFVAAISLFTSCDNEQDPIFDDSPETRINNVLTKYKTALTKDDGYWIAYYSGSAILMKFNEDNTVEFESTYSDGSEDRTISYRVSITQVPELVFESHSVFQAIYEDNLATGEYEFLFDKVTDDRIDFISKTDKGANKTKLTFFKGVPEDIATVKKIISKMEKSFFKHVSVEGSNYKAMLVTNGGNAIWRTISKDGKIENKEYEFSMTKDGLVFSPAVEIEGVEVTLFDNQVGKDLFSANVEGKTINIEIGNAPLTEESGVYEEFMATNFKVINGYSQALSSIVPSLKEDIKQFNAFQIYVEWGYLLGYAPGHEGGNWAGFSKFAFTKAAEDITVVTWGYGAYGAWWSEIYGNDGGKLLLEFLTDPSGLYIVKAGNDTYYLVSKADPSKYILVG